MSRRKFYRILSAIFLLLLFYGLYYCSQAVPIAAGYGAKIMCSAIFVSGRNEQSVKSEELHFFPLTLASHAINYKDSSVTCSIFGLGKVKAIYRTGLGATLVNDFPESEIRKQRFKIPMPAPFNTDSVSWPMGDKIENTFPLDIDSSKIAWAMEQVFRYKVKALTNITRALLVVHDGQIVAERYADGFTTQTKFAGWSMAKSITGAMVGVLVKQNKLVVDSPAPVPEWNNTNDPRHQIKLMHLLQQTSGLDFDEVYDKPSKANRMLFVRGDAAGYTATQKLARAPGTDFRYSSGNSNILSRICRQADGDEAYHALPYKELFFKLGMYHTLLEVDASGTFLGSSFCHASLRDWARFGLLYLNNGRWNNEQILPNDWVRLSTTPSTAAEKGEYGFQWWLNAGEKGNTSNRMFPDLPIDMYYASGFEGQNIFIIPSKKLVVVRLGLSRDKHWGENEFLKSVIQAISN